MMNNVYGYCIAGYKQQSKKEMLSLMKEYHVPEENVIFEKRKNHDSDRPAFHKLLSRLKDGDLVYIESIDVLGSDYNDIILNWTAITKSMNADICVIDTPVLDTRTAKDMLGTVVTDVFVALLSFASENNRLNRKIKQAEGIANAKERGVHFGGRKKPLPEGFEDVVRRWRNQEISAVDAAAECGMSKTTFYNRVKEIE